ncbi:MAG: type II toxin-antitoxin system VapC family toxin [Actinomycetaceae bacterium]|nr:type II toxin-antitoxin system VapC family toxin [Actinomycetaceae bacterium]
MDSSIAIDTSVAVPLLLENHDRHGRTLKWADGKKLALAGHAAIETFAVLTRLPGDSRVLAPHAKRIIHDRFPLVLSLDTTAFAQAYIVLADAGIAGGATYDGLVALAAKTHNVPLATSDRRAVPTYERLGVQILLV